MFAKSFVGVRTACIICLTYVALCAGIVSVSSEYLTVLSQQKQFRSHTCEKAKELKRQREIETFLLEKGKIKCAFCATFLFFTSWSSSAVSTQKVSKSRSSPVRKMSFPRKAWNHENTCVFPQKRLFWNFYLKNRKIYKNCTWATPATKITAIADLILAKSQNRDWRRFTERGGEGQYIKWVSFFSYFITAWSLSLIFKFGHERWV